MKKFIVLFLFAFIVISFVICPALTISASQKGIMLWFEKIFPILFPCIIVSNILLATNITQNNTRFIPVIIVLCGLLCGFPIGSKLSADCYKKGLISKKMAQCLCNYTNQLSLAYISGFVIKNCIDGAYNLLNIYLLIYMPSLAFLFYEIPKTADISIKTKKTASRFRFNMQIVDAGIISGFETLIKLCGYIVIFSIFVESINLFLEHSYFKYILIGLIENTNGISMLIDAPIPNPARVIMAIGITTFGGISCIIQTASIIKDTDLSIRKYVIAKIFTASLSILLTCIYLLGVRFS